LFWHLTILSGFFQELKRPGEKLRIVSRGDEDKATEG